MSMNLGQARGTGPSSLESKKPAKSVVCKKGYVNFQGRCVPQEQRNKKNNTQQISRGNTINKSNRRFYNV